MYQDGKIWVGTSGEEKVYIYPKMANRHGLIAGATGTGKTVTLKVLAESFSDAGVPVFLADVKGDLAGMCRPGQDSADMQQRIADFKLNECGFQYQSYPTTFWDIFGTSGIPLRTTISEMGPLLLSKLMDLNDTQSDIMSIIFKIADDQELLLIDTKDLKSMLQFVSEHNKEFAEEYGNIAKQSIGAILRSLVALEAQGADQFFGEPALNIVDWFSNGIDGKGMINILDCQVLINNPAMYSVFLLWMMSELFETLPEVGDMDRPRMVFFFDEAHLLFKDAPKALVEKVEQVVRLIRSKGVSVWFITQVPSDLPDSVLSQIGNRVQHALRAYTPKDQKGLRAAAQSFRVNPRFDTEQALQALGVGEALVSVLDEKGVPTIVEKAGILPPRSSMEAVFLDVIQKNTKKDPLYSRYGKTEDRESAYEELTQLQEEAEEAARKQEKEAQKEAEKKARQKTAASRKKSSVLDKAVSSAANTIGRELGRSLIRGLLGTLTK